MTFKSLCVSQGNYDDLAVYNGGIDALSELYAVHDVVCLSHVAALKGDGTSLPNPSGCIDSQYDDMPLLIEKIRHLNPNVEIFGYVSGTADAPTGCGYGDGHQYIDNHWMPPNGISINFIEWVKKWDGQGIDGILIDLVSPVYMSEANLANIYSYCRLKGYKIMANSTYPSITNVNFASLSLGFGDYLLIEAFCYGNGVSTLTDTNAAITALNLKRAEQGFSMASLCSEAWSTGKGQFADPANQNNINAFSLVQGFGSPGDAYQYDVSDLGIISLQVPKRAF